MDPTKLTDLDGTTSHDPNAVAAAVKAALANIPEEIQGLSARVAVFEGQDIVKALAELAKLQGSVEGLQSLKDSIPEDQSEKIATMAAQLDGVSAQLLSGGAAPGSVETPVNLGELIFEDEGFQAMISDSRSDRGVYKIKLKEHKGVQALGSVKDILAGVSAAPVLAAAELGALRWSTRQTEIVQEPKESVAEFMPAIGVIPAPGFQVYEWPKETLDSATGYMRTTLDTALTGSSVTPVTSCNVADASHFSPGTYVRFFDASHAKLGRLKLVSADFTSTQNTLTFGTNLIDWDQAKDTNITSEQWLGTPEGEGKPYTLLSGETTSVNAVTMAIMAAVTRQQLLSPSGIMAWIQQELPSRTRDNIAQALLYGAGTTGKSLMGFFSVSGAQTSVWSDGEVGDNRIDAILRAVLKVLGGTPSIVMNKTDFSILRLQKDKNENYLLANTIGRVSLEMVGDTWILDGKYPIIESEAIQSGDFLCCDFKMASKIIDAEDEAIEWGVINEDFANNIRRARYELTLAHAVQRLKSFVLCEWDEAPSA